MAFPEMYGSERQYRDYLRCKLKLRAGDSVCIYMSDDERFTPMVTGRTSEPLLVVGVGGSPAERRNTDDGPSQLIGSMVRGNNGLYLHSHLARNYRSSVPNFNSYEYGYLLISTDCRIARIIRKA